MFLKVCIGVILALTVFPVDGEKNDLNDISISCTANGTIILQTTLDLDHKYEINSSKSKITAKGKLYGTGTITISTPTSLSLGNKNIFTVKLKGSSDDFVRDVKRPKASAEEAYVWNWGTADIQKRNELMSGALVVGACIIIVMGLIISLCIACVCC
ncbi:unnamed protein product, partial [Mesorhabditis belari]|uniref:Uncharacterized protein n=1 Tax=Mesorhabditis belari TaxID=2138241 RepID=A0AAF3F9X6_9BILA